MLAVNYLTAAEYPVRGSGCVREKQVEREIERYIKSGLSLRQSGGWVGGYRNDKTKYRTTNRSPVRIK
jgi:hypothetical protein